jgi:hypothetical protein
MNATIREDFLATLDSEVRQSLAPFTGKILGPALAGFHLSATVSRFQIEGSGRIIEIDTARLDATPARTEAMATNKTITRQGYDLVLMPERDGFTCRVYREGKNAPLSCTMADDEAEAVAWFERFLSRSK